MNIESTIDGIIYSYFTYSRVDTKTNNEKGMICVNVIQDVKSNDPKRNGWVQCDYWLDFNDDLFKYLKEALIKKSKLKIRLVPDFRDNSKYTTTLIGINDFVIKP